MPALVVCGKKWLVGTDDFVVPSLLAIIIRIVCIAFIVGVLVYLYFGPPECLDVNGDMEGVPPFLYGSLFSVIFVLSLSILNENIIFSISIKGNILDTKNKRKYILFWLSLRIGLIVFETLDIIICTFAVFGPAPYAAGALVCPEYHNGPLVYAKVVMVVMLTTQLIYVVGFFVFVDPLGLCCSPSILPDMHRVEGYGSKTYQEVENEEKSYPKNSRLGHLHRSHVGYGKVLKKVKSIMCCLNANGNRSRQTAMQEMALALHTLFSDDDRVPSDLVAGLMLVSRYQKAKSGDCNSCSGKGIKCSCLFRGLKKLTFDHMPNDQKPEGFAESEQTKEFDASNEEERLMLEDMVHYMRYAMGMYGWPLHVFDKPCCGICELCTITCCACNYRCCHRMARPQHDTDYPQVAQDDCCMSGLGTIRLRSKLRESHVLHICFENEVFQAPFSICCDESRRAIVLTIRGTLSIKDVMTDFSVSMMDMEQKYRNPYVKGKQRVHVGMYCTAKYIRDTLESKQLLAHAFQGEFKDYRLVISGHSLGAGVASVLSVMLKPYYPDLQCFAFSPPGCVFSFPLAYYSRDFITSVVMGNDMVPRTTFRSLLYLKRQIEFLIQNCQYSKFQIIFRPRFMDKLPFFVRHCLFGDKRDPIMEASMFHDELKERMKKASVKSQKENGFDSGVKVWSIFNKWRRASKKKKDSLHSFIAGVENGKHEASFPPGKILHIGIQYSKKPGLLHYCYPDTLNLHYVNSEDLCVIVVDRGLVDDHLPNNVLRGLLRSQKELVGRRYNANEVKSLRERQMADINIAIDQRKPFGEVLSREPVPTSSSPLSACTAQLTIDSQHHENDVGDQIPPQVEILLPMETMI